MGVAVLAATPHLSSFNLPLSAAFLILYETFWTITRCVPKRGRCADFSQRHRTAAADLLSGVSSTRRNRANAAVDVRSGASLGEIDQDGGVEESDAAVAGGSALREIRE